MKIIGIYPGRFQPPHRGHLKLYNYVKNIVGPANAYIATSDKTDPIKSPLNFQEKQQIWARHGVPIDKIVKVVNPYKSEEITHKFNPKNTAAIFFLSKKDASRMPFTRKDGQPAYFQPYKGNENSLLPIKQHSYIAISPTFKIDGKYISGSKVREGLGSPKFTKSQKKKFFQWVFGWFDIGLFEMLVAKFTDAERQKGIEEQMVGGLRESKSALKNLIKELVRELVFPVPAGHSVSVNTDKTDSSIEEPVSDPETKRGEEEKIRADKEAEKKKHQWLLSKKKHDQMTIKQDDRDIRSSRQRQSDFDSAIKDLKN